MRNPLVTISALAAVLGIAGPAAAALVRDHRNPSVSGGAYTLSAAPVFEMTLALTAGKATSCETRNLTGAADPVLHLLAPNGDTGTVKEVARDDDSAGQLNARITFTPTVTGRHRLILRAAGDGRTGTADLFCDGKPVWFKLPVGGAFRRLETLRQGETLTTVPLPRAPTGYLVYLFDDSGRMLQRYLTNVTQGVSVATGSLHFANVMVGSVWPDITGPVRLVRNDRALSGHDPDGDGLGTELEKQIGTCSNRTEVVGNWECSRSADARDTDGDGLRDDWELLGLTGSAPYQFLPRWGADPLHKDLFIQVDAGLATTGEAQTLMPVSEARELSNIYGDPETSPLLRLLHAQYLQNPDLQPGIHVHLDTGVNPAADALPGDFTAFGDWGGHGVVGAKCSNGTCQRADAGDIWAQHLQQNRRGVFHYALGYPGSGGQAPFDTIALNLPVQSGDTAAHELGHTLGLDHSGPRQSAPNANCKPNYPSIMSYAYLGSSGFDPAEFSDGYGRPPLNNVALPELGALPPASSQVYLKQLRDVLHFKVDLTAGSVDWNRDGVFSPSTVRAYANDNGECEFTRVNAVPVPGLSSLAPAIVRLAGTTLIFTIDEGNSRLRLALTHDDLSCPGIEGRCGPPLTSRSIDDSWNRGILAMDAHRIAVDGQPRILLVYRTSAGFFETTMTADLHFTAPRAIPGGSPAVDEFALAGNDDHTIMAYKAASGAVMVRVRSSNPGSWDGDEPARDPAGAAIVVTPGSSPGLLEARVKDGTVQLFAVFPAGDNGALRLYTQYNATGRWVRSLWENNEESSIGRPALAMVPVDPASILPGRLRILSLLRADTGNFIVRMRSLEVVQETPPIVVGQPHGGPIGPRPLPGRFGGPPRVAPAPIVVGGRDLTTVAGNVPDRNAHRLVVRPAGGPGGPGGPGLPQGPVDTIRLVDEHFDNEWYYGNGVDLLFEPGIDSNLRAVVATAMLSKGVPQPHNVELRPKADGVVDFVQRNGNDWLALGVDLCRVLVPTGSTGIHCPAWPFN